MPRALALLLIFAVLPIAAAEVLLRWFPVRTPRQVHFSPSSRSMRLDPDLIWRLQPGVSYEVETSEFREHRFTNSLGMREREIPPRRPGERRLLALGDSFTYGAGVQASEAYPRIVEDLLRARGDPTMVLNAGVPGYSFDQSFRAAAEREQQTDADVILAGISCSDVEEGWLWPLYALRDGRLKALPAWKTGFYLQGLLTENLPAWLARSALFQQGLRRLPARDFFFQRPGGSRESLRAWTRDKIALQLEALQRSATESGHRIVALFMPCKEQLDPGAVPVYADMLTRAAAAGLPVVDGMAALRSASPDVTRLFYTQDVHLNRDGHHALAVAVAGMLAEGGIAGGA